MNIEAQKFEQLKSFWLWNGRPGSFSEDLTKSLLRGLGWFPDGRLKR